MSEEASWSNSSFPTPTRRRLSVKSETRPVTTAFEDFARQEMIDLGREAADGCPRTDFLRIMTDGNGVDLIDTES